MKKILAGLFILAVPVSAFAAFGGVWRSSYTTTADTAQSLCSDSGTGKRRGILHGVCVGVSGTGTISVYNAYNTAVNPVAVISSSGTVSAGCSAYDVDMSSGIVYTVSSAGNRVTFLYQCSN